MTTLEHASVPHRSNNSPRFDWDHLVQEHRVHRTIYTDPAIFDAEMNSCLRRNMGVSRPREPDSQRE